MESILFRSFFFFFSLGVFLISPNQAIGQALSLKSGSLIEKRIPHGRSQEVQVMNPRGNLQWQKSTDGTNWDIWAGKTEMSVTIVVNEVVFLRCAIQEANCDRVYSDILELVPFDMATVHTATVREIKKISAVCGGKIITDGGDAIQQKGVCWSINLNPTITDSKTSDGEGPEDFASSLTGLTSGTSYFVRAYAINNAGIAYGDQVNFRTAPEIILPEISTMAAYGIGQTTAVSGGNITNDGGGTITSRGVCWSTAAGPTTADRKTSDGTGSGSFTSRLTGLTGNTVYYLRAYATNSAGTVYGNEISFKTTPVLPTVATTSVSDITQTSATSGGVVTSDGGAGITARGVCWSTSSNPTTADNKTSNDTGTGSFISILTGLTGNTTYFVRAYAINSAGASYGNEISFKTSPLTPTVATASVSAITQTSATSVGIITSDGGAGITARGVCWSVYANPSVSDNRTNGGTGTGVFSSSLTGLTGNTTYYIRAYATNAAGTSYGNEISFKTSPVLPTVTTTAVSGITQTTVNSGGIVYTDGGAEITSRGVCWSTAPKPTLADSRTTNGTGTGVFTSSLTGLNGNTTFYIRAYATNTTGTSYGDEVSFKTSPILAKVATTAISGVTQTSAYSGGIIYSDGGTSVVARGVCWSTSPMPTIADSKTIDGSGTGFFTSILTNLSGNTTYYVRAYATNNIGTSYGEEVSFKTSPVSPMVTTATASEITQTSASSGGTIFSDGGSSITSRGVCWSTVSNPTTADSKTTDGAGTGAFTSKMTGLTGNTIYFVRAFATNSAGTNYGNEINFRTSPVLPAVTTTSITAISQTSAIFGGKISSDGGSPILAKGVCWATETDAPTIGHPHTSDGTGSGSFTSYLTGLTGNTLYYVRAYSINSAGTSYGNTISFHTSPVLPAVTTTAISAVTQTTATSGGNIGNDGGAAITSRGVCWSTAQNPTTGDFKTSDGTGTGAFTSSMTGLSANTHYYVRAYASNSAGTSYGNQENFTTLNDIIDPPEGDEPTIVTSDISNVTRTTAVACGILMSFGDAELTGLGFCYSTSPNPTIANMVVDVGLTRYVVGYLGGLTGNTTYYARAFASNKYGTGYGKEIMFKTKGSDSEPSTNVLLIDGDSRTSGFNCSYYYPFGPLLKLDETFDLFYAANGGLTTAEFLVKGNVDPHLTPSSPRNIVLMWAGNIDIALVNYRWPASIPYNNLVTYCNMRRAKGWKVIICTEISAGGTGPYGQCDAVRLELNDLIRANWTQFADGLADLGAHPSIGYFEAYKDPLFYCDDLHLTNAGTGCVAQVISDAINSFIKH